MSHVPDPPSPVEVPVEVGTPPRPSEITWDEGRATHDARLDLARKVYFLVVGVVFAIALLSGVALLPLVTTVPTGTYESAKEASNFLATSLLPAIIGIFGSIIGFYFGRESRDRPK